MANRFAITGLTLLSGLVLSPSVFAQNNPNNNSTAAITTAVPFLRISPDARSGAMGDVGIALSPDANAQYWNVGKIAASKKDAGLSVTYTPWLKDIAPDVFLAYLAGYKKFGEGDNQALSASLRYFNLGDINYTDINAMPAGDGKPREFAVDLGYSRNLSEYLSMGIALRYINSNIAAGAPESAGSYRAGNAFGADIGLYYHKAKVMTEERQGTFSAGATLSNVGSKITYSQERKDFLPINLGIGAAYEYQVDQFNKITGELDLNKTLVPAPKFITDDQGNSYWESPTQGVVSGMLNSFGNAPKGYGTTISVGGEYWYQDQFALRAGYFYENANNGDRQYFTCGLGIRYNVFGLDFSYLIPSGSGTTRNPLSNTLRFTLSFDFDQLNFNNQKS
ncbi:MAG TPA: type IX secretion system outer membrane channel protein PorV [Edaphocola sp.]|nr:type IX secretion system outer membrane channel protein PorV [Edaphocola sp.]